MEPLYIVATQLKILMAVGTPTSIVMNEKMTPEQIAKAKHLLLEWKTNGTND